MLTGEMRRTRRERNLVEETESHVIVLLLLGLFLLLLLGSGRRGGLSGGSSASTSSGGGADTGPDRGDEGLQVTGLQRLDTRVKKCLNISHKYYSL